MRAVCDKVSKYWKIITSEKLIFFKFENLLLHLILIKFTVKRKFTLKKVTLPTLSPRLEVPLSGLSQ